MKKIYILLLLFIGATLIGCDPMDDIHEQVNDQIDSEGALADKSIVLTEDDYGFLGLSFPNFNSEDDARLLIPDLLSERYPYYGKNSSINVIYDIYDPIRVKLYEVTSQDYSAIGLEEGYFS